MFHAVSREPGHTWYLLDFIECFKYIDEGILNYKRIFLNLLTYTALFSKTQGVKKT